MPVALDIHIEISHYNENAARHTFCVIGELIRINLHYITNMIMP
jgi:hypothetical protein